MWPVRMRCSRRGLHEERGFGERAVHDTGCSGLSCSGPGGGGIGIGNAGPLAEAGVLGRTGGIDFVSASDLDAGSWGGWIGSSGFGVLLEREGMGAGLRERRYGLALGRLTEVAEGPDMNAVWRGRMVGVTEEGGFPDGRLQGVAVLTYRAVLALGDDAESGDVAGADRCCLYGDRERLVRRLLPGRQVPECAGQACST